MESKRVTYLIMKKHDRLTLKQGRAVLKALAEIDINKVLSNQDKPNLRIAIEKLTEAVEDAEYRHEIRCERDAVIAKLGEKKL